MGVELAQVLIQAVVNLAGLLLIVPKRTHTFLENNLAGDEDTPY